MDRVCEDTDDLELREPDERKDLGTWHVSVDRLRANTYPVGIELDLCNIVAGKPTASPHKLAIPPTTRLAIVHPQDHTRFERKICPGFVVVRLKIVQSVHQHDRLNRVRLLRARA